jgi:response regulator RpfG family c-di-GMP phosphodiesterase
MQLARDTAEEMSADAETVQEVILGTLLRDIGRVAAEPDGTYPGSATSPDDHERVREHVSASLRLLEHVDFPWKVLPVIRHHHERYNGSGSPDGLRGREIPMGARIVSVVDAFVDMTSGRRSDAIEPERALQELVRRAGHQFDPEVVEAFHRVMDKRLAGRHAKHKPVVLIADSNDHFRRLLKMRLTNEGIGVEEADSPRRTLKLLRKRSPDLLLIDVDTEATDAFPILHEIQQDPQLCGMPVAFLASRHDRVMQLRALRQGVDDFLLKTDDMEVLLARIENILMRSAMRAEGEVRKSRRGITGSLENLSLPDIIQTLTIGMKTACVTVCSDDRQGRIWFENGAPKHAETDRARSEQAFYEMVRWTTGEFVIEHGIRSEDRSLSHDAMFLLMEGLRLMDEEANPDAALAAT